MDLSRFLRNQWDRVGAWLCVIGGAGALLAGYLGVSGTLETGKQLPYVVSGGMGGLFLLGLGALLWLSADLRDEWRKLDAIDRHLQQSQTLPAPAPPSTTAAGTNGLAGNIPLDAEKAATQPDSCAVDSMSSQASTFLVSDSAQSSSSRASRQSGFVAGLEVEDDPL